MTSKHPHHTGRRNFETCDLDFQGGKARHQGARNHQLVRRGGDRVPLPSALAQASVGRVAKRCSAALKWKNQVQTVVIGSPAYISWPDPGTNTSSPCQKSWMLQQNSLTGMAVPASRSIAGDPSSRNWTGSRSGDPSLTFGVPLPSSSHVTAKGFEPDHGKIPASLVLAQGSLPSLLDPPPSLKHWVVSHRLSSPATQQCDDLPCQPQMTPGIALQLQGVVGGAPPALPTNPPPPKTEHPLYRTKHKLPESGF